MSEIGRKRPANGPWETDGELIFDADGNCLAEMRFSGMEADAYLMGAARELYDAGKELLAVGIINPTGNERVEKAKRKLLQAVRKADGV